MITDQIRRHKVLLPINHNFNKNLWYIRLFFKIKKEEIPIFFANTEKNHLSARDGAHCPIT